MEAKAGTDALRLAGREPISLESFLEISERCSAVVNRVRTAMLAPNTRKAAPTFQTAQMAALQGLDVKQVDYRAKRGDLPSGHVKAPGQRRTFSLEDVRAWSTPLRGTQPA